MNWSVKKYNIVKVLLIIIILMDIRFFYFYNYNGWNVFFFAIFTFMFTIMFCPSFDGYPTRSLRKIVIWTVLSFVLVFAWSYIKYGNGLKTTLGGESSNYKMLFILLSYPMMYVCACKRSVKWILQLLNKFAMIFYILIPLQFIAYNLNGTVFLNAMSVSSELPIMNGSLRIALSWLGEMMIIYNFYMLYCPKEKVESKAEKYLYVFNFALGFVDSLVVSRVRGSILPLCICLIIIVLFQRNTLKSFWRKIVLIAVLCVLAFSTDIFSSFFASFSETASRSYSTTARLYAIDYYWNTFLKNPVCGFGFADGVINYHIVHGDGRAAISDVGIFGVLAKYGIFTLAIYVIPLIRSFVLIKRMFSAPNIKNQLLYLAIGLYIAGTSFTLIAISHFRMMQWVVYIVMIEYTYWAAMNEVCIEE